MSGKYILDEKGNPIPEPDLLKWAQWLEGADRKIGRDTIGEVCISTVFLGLDQDIGGASPLLYETMIFGGQHDGYQARYATKEEAKKGHEKAIELVRAKEK